MLLVALLLLTFSRCSQDEEVDNKDEMVLIKGGNFLLGNHFELNRKNGQPVYEVVLKDFYIAPYEVTFEDYDAFCKNTIRKLPDDLGWGRDDRPVINISWMDVVIYCNWLSQQNGYIPAYDINRGKVEIDWEATGYRLPTEIEWEYAALSQGQNERWSGTSVVDSLSQYANGKDTIDNYLHTAPVGSFRSNRLGLYDMSGNVAEWCWNWIWSDSDSINVYDPRGYNAFNLRAARGGGWNSNANELRCTQRKATRADLPRHDIGFRLVRSVIRQSLDPPHQQE